METLNERIKSLRKGKGWTQLQLAENLNVTDKAVSKWEVGEANPDISLIINIAALFGVTLDYLLTGKAEEEKISLDDMDSDKRAEYLAKKDDAENFKKYGYVNKYILFSDDAMRALYARDSMRKLRPLRTAIIENHSTGIFSLLLDEFVKFAGSNECARTNGQIFSPAYFVLDIIDDFVKMAAELGRLDVLDLIKFKWFYIGSAPAGRKDDMLVPFCIARDTIKYILTGDCVSEKVMDYISDPVFLMQIRKQEMYGMSSIIPAGGTMVNEVLLRLFNNNDTARINKVMDSLYHNLRTSAVEYANYSTYDDTRNGYRDVVKKYENGFCYSRKTSNSYNYFTYYAYVPVIDLALKAAKDGLNIDMLTIFNDYNLEVAKTLGEKVLSLNEEEIRMLKIKADPTKSDDAKLVASYSKYGILDYRALIATCYNSSEEDRETAKWHKEVIERIESVYNKVVKSAPICFMELIERLIGTKNYRGLFEFVTDYGLSALEEAVIACDNAKIIEVAKSIFTPSDAFQKELEKLINEKKAATERNKIYHSNASEIKRIDDRISRHKEALYSGSETICDMLKWQYSIVDYNSLCQMDNASALCESIKKEYVDRLIKREENTIEEITMDKKCKSELERVANEIPFDYLREELSKGNLDNVVIKLCVRMESILKFGYRYDGDLFEMVDRYVHGHFIMKELHNCWDDEDNNYYRYQQEDEEFKIENERIKAKTDVLHTLRMKRNSLVHADKSGVEMSAADIELCIDIVEAM